MVNWKKHWLATSVLGKGQQSERDTYHILSSHTRSSKHQRKAHFFDKLANLSETRLHAQIALFFFFSVVLSERIRHNKHLSYFESGFSFTLLGRNFMEQFGDDPNWIIFDSHRQDEPERNLHDSWHNIKWFLLLHNRKQWRMCLQIKLTFDSFLK